MVLTTVNSKMANGTFVAVGTAAAFAIAMDVWAHMRACLDSDADLKPHIKAAATLEVMSMVDMKTNRRLY